MRDCNNNHQNVSRVSVFRNKPGPFLFLQAKILYGSGEPVVFSLSFLNIKVKLFKTVFFLDLHNVGVTKTRFPIMLCCNGTQLECTSR